MTKLFAAVLFCFASYAIVASGAEDKAPAAATPAWKLSRVSVTYSGTKTVRQVVSYRTEKKVKPSIVIGTLFGKPPIKFEVKQVPVEGDVEVQATPFSESRDDVIELHGPSTDLLMLKIGSAGDVAHITSESISVVLISPAGKPIILNWDQIPGAHVEQPVAEKTKLVMDSNLLRFMTE